jgi:membrane protease YdiL (CAAX protease family)
MGRLPALVAYLAGLAIVAAIVRAQRRSWRDDLGLFLPAPAVWLRWVAGWLGWIGVSELLTRRLNLPRPGPRAFASGWERALWVATLVLLAPISEESVFRGLLYSRISTTRLGVPGAVVVGAAIFSLLHIESPTGYRAIIAIDGLAYGLARAQTCSLAVPVLLHAIGNVYAVWQRLRPAARTAPDAASA